MVRHLIRTALSLSVAFAQAPAFAQSGADAWAATDLGRFRHSQLPNTLSLEAPLYDLVGARLSAMGHRVSSINGESVGGAQIIMRVPDGAGGSYYRSGSDFRKDGQAAGW